MKRAAPWLAAALGLGFTLLAFWPGYLSWDSAYQWWQARGGALDPGHPLLMVRLWQGARLVLPDPGGMLLLQAGLWWAALALFAQALGGSAGSQVARVLVIGFWPPLLALLPHLWKDVWMMAWFLLAVALLALDVRAPRRRWRIAAFLALVLGCSFRFNALAAALPLLAWLAWRERPGHAGVVALATLALAALLQLAGLGLNHGPQARERPIWPMLALWDLSAVSIAEDQLLIPRAWVDPAVDVGDLRRDFRPDVNVTSFEHGQLRLPGDPVLTAADYDQLRAAWWALPVEHAHAYLSHRARISAYLFGLRQAEHPDGLVLQPSIVAYRDNPVVEPPSGGLHAALQPRLNRLVDTVLFAPWPYLLAALALLVIGGRRRREPAAALAVAVAGSSLMLAAPLLVLAPSSDFRYLGWCLLAALLAVALLLAPRARHARRC